MSAGGPQSASAVPTASEADLLASSLLAEQGTRLAHVRSAGYLATRLASMFDHTEAALLVAAATLHDIGYAPDLARTGFHPLDGAVFLRERGFAPRLTALIAHHSLAGLMAPPHPADALNRQFRQEHSLLSDALVYADMHSGPDGRIIRAEARLADIGARRPTAQEAHRAHALRAAMGRVGAAVLASGSGSGTWQQPDRPAGDRPVPGRPGLGFEAWWRQEARRCVAAARSVELCAARELHEVADIRRHAAADPAGASA